MTGSFSRTLRTMVKALALAATAGLSSLSTPGLAQDYPHVINIGSTAPGHLKFVLARHHGWLEEEFAAEGIQIELLPFTGGGSEAVTALATGALHFAYIGANPSLRSAAIGADIKLVGLSSWVRSGGSGITVRTDSDIESLEDLRGRRIAYLHGTNRHSSLAKALELVGLTTNDIESLNISFDASGPALLRGDIDALVESDNTVQRLIDTGEARKIFDGNDYPDWSTPSTILVNGTFAQRYPEVVERVLSVDLRLAQWADDNYEEAIELFVEGTGASEDAVRQNYRDGVFHQDPTLLEGAIEALKAEERFMADAGLLTGSVDYDIWVDSSYLDAAKERLAQREAGSAAQ